jgi:2-keto-4-pentenoate hydratase/2-oxohepta-3-ene-1,7-dioic acid hydratase in catechol pathway
VQGWRALDAASGPVYPVSEVQLEAPVRPGKLICIGLNYRDHAEETGQEIPAAPVVFAKFTSALIGPGEAIVVPYDEPRTDYEAELALVIGTRVRRVSGAAALAAVGGITGFNDVSGREAQFGPGKQFTRGKSYDTFAPIGPCIAPVDGLDLGALRVKCTLSGEVMQDSSTANLIFGVQTLVEFCSAAFTLEPGDVIATGTPPGVGDARRPPRYLQDGDVVEIEVEGVGVLRNPCVAEERPQ